MPVVMETQCQWLACLLSKDTTGVRSDKAPKQQGPCPSGCLGCKGSRWADTLGLLPSLSLNENSSHSSSPPSPAERESKGEKEKESQRDRQRNGEAGRERERESKREVVG